MKQFKLIDQDQKDDFYFLSDAVRQGTREYNDWELKGIATEFSVRTTVVCSRSVPSGGSETGIQTFCRRHREIYG